MIQYQIEMPGLPKLNKPKKYPSFVEMFADENYPDEKKLYSLAWVCSLATLNSVTKDELVAMLRWVVNENYYWKIPEEKPKLRVVK